MFTITSQCPKEKVLLKWILSEIVTRLLLQCMLNGNFT